MPVQTIPDAIDLDVSLINGPLLDFFKSASSEDWSTRRDDALRCIAECAAEARRNLAVKAEGKGAKASLR